MEMNGNWMFCWCVFDFGLFGMGLVEILVGGSIFVHDEIECD